MNTAKPHRREPMRFFTMPRDERFDSTLALLADPYRYIGNQCRRLGSEHRRLEQATRST